MDIGPTTNGRRSFHITAATIAAVSSSLGIVIFLGGFITGFLVMRQNLTDLQNKTAAIQSELSSISNRMTKIEDKMDYTVQGVADLKALTAGTHR